MVRGDGLVQERCNSMANPLELCLPCTNPPFGCTKNFTKVIKTWPFTKLKNVTWLYCSFIWLSCPCIFDKKEITLFHIHWFSEKKRNGNTVGEQWGYTLFVKTLRLRQDGRHFTDNIFKCIFFNENFRILIRISLKFVANSPINNIPAFVQIMAWRRPGDSHNLNQCCYLYQRLYASLGLNELKPK